MKKAIVAILAGLFAVSAIASKVVVEYTPDTNNVVTVTGTYSDGMVPVSVAQEITGTTTNTISTTYNPKTASDSTTVYRLTPLTAVVGGAEVPQALVSGTTGPVIIKKDDVWTLTGSGTDYSNVIFIVTYDLP